MLFSLADSMEKIILYYITLFYNISYIKPCIALHVIYNLDTGFARYQSSSNSGEQQLVLNANALQVRTKLST